MSTLQIKRNRDVLLSLSVVKRSGVWRVSGPLGSASDVNIQTATFRVLLDHLLARPRFRAVVKERLGARQQ